MDNQSTQSEHVLRLFEILRRIPRAPRAATAAQLHSALGSADIAVTRRSIERDLNSLLASFPLIATETKPRKWSWLVGAEGFQIPGMRPEEALTLLMVERQLLPMLPGPVRTHLAPYLDAARETLARQPAITSVKGWLDRVRVISRLPPLTPPKVSESVTTAVYDALLRGHQLLIRYRARGRTTEREAYTIHPLALIWQEPALYLVARLNDGALRTYALHRMAGAEVLDEAAVRPAGFSLDDCIASGELGFSVGDRPLNLVARIAPVVAQHLEECPLPGQKPLRKETDGWLRLHARVADTEQLRWWLRGFGDKVEVIGPKRLREEMAQVARGLAKHYRR